MEDEKKYLRLHFVGETATGKGNNQYFEMEVNEDGETFKWTLGRIGITAGRSGPRSGISPLSEWDNVLNAKLGRGWIVYSDHKIETKVIKKKGQVLDGKKFRDIDDKSVNDLLGKLWIFAQKIVEDTYSVKVTEIPQSMLDMGRQALDELIKLKDTMSDAEFNNKLHAYYGMIPRRMDKVTTLKNTKGNSSKEKKETILKAEEELYNFLLDQIRSSKQLEEQAKKENDSLPTALEAFNLEMREVTDEERKYVLSKMDTCDQVRVTNIWRVKNNVTEERFDKFCKAHKIDEDHISHLWHGSNAGNWWSIITNGLWLKPGTITANGLFGYGLYFAPQSNKSVGYTGLGCWRGNSERLGYLALNKVATGNIFWFYRDRTAGHQDMCLKGLTARGCDSLWAERDTSKSVNDYYALRRDEVIVYREEQVTIEYLVEFA